MKDLKMLCESCTIVDRVYFGKLPIGQFNVQIQNPFTILANQHLIRTAVKATSVNVNPVNGEFMDDKNVSYQYVPFPPKFSAQHFTDNAASDETKEKMKRLIEHSGLFSEIGAIGINYDLYIDSNLVKDLKDKILSDKISNECGFSSTTLTFKLNDRSALNLMITQDVKLANSQNNVTIFNSNIHIPTESFDEKNFISEIFENDLYTINSVKEKINMLLSL